MGRSGEPVAPETSVGTVVEDEDKALDGAVAEHEESVREGFRNVSDGKTPDGKEPEGSETPVQGEGTKGPTAAKVVEPPPKAPEAPSPPRQPVPGAQPQTTMLTREEAQSRIQEIERGRAEVQDMQQRINAVMQDPRFQEAYQKAYGPQAGQQPGEQPPTPGPNDIFKDLDESDPIVQGMVRSHQTLSQKFEGTVGELVGVIEGMKSQLTVLQNFYHDQNSSEADSQINDALEKVKGDFPDLLGTKEKEDLLMNKATAILLGYVHARQPITVEQAVMEAAQSLGYASVAERERLKLQRDASRAAGVVVESPEGTTGPENVDFETNVRRGLRKIQGRP